MMERRFVPLLLVMVAATLVSGCNRTSSGEFHAVAEVKDVPPETPAATVEKLAPPPVETITLQKPATDATDAAVVPAPAEIARIDSPAAAAPPGPPLAPQSVIPASASSGPRIIELKVPEKAFEKEGSEGSLRISFDDLDLLRVLNMEPVPLDAARHFPGWLSALDGQNVRLRGWMFPPPQTEDLPQFLFVRDNQICCFGREAKVYDKVAVTLKDGVTTNYIQGRPFDVEGRFRIQAEVLGDELYLLYFLEDAVLTGS